MEQLRNIFKIEELRSRILVTMGLLVVFRLGAKVLLPGVDYSQVEVVIKQFQDQMGNFFGFMGIVSGGAFDNMALFSLGIMPYITSSIIMSLMTKVHPALEALAKEGPSGQRKISQYTRYLTFPIALVQAIMTYNSISDPRQGLLYDYSIFGGMVIVSALVAGSLFVMWLGEQITEFGLGNGASVLIMCGILARMPQIGMEFRERINQNPDFLTNVIVIVALYIVVIFAIVYITQSQRRIPIQHAKHFRGRRVMMGQRNYLPLKLNTAGVMPVIFASSLMTIPYLLGSIPWLSGIQNEFTPGRFVYVLFYVVCIFFFSYFWTYLFMQPNEMANNLKEYGSFIPGIRPGENTASYINYILARLTLCGAFFLCVIALVPDIVAFFLGMDRFLVAFLGGTGILIVVGVCLDILQKTESYLLLHHYGGIAGSTAMRGRR
jgi:preprotein translocase subunit SecY